MLVESGYREDCGREWVGGAEGEAVLSWHDVVGGVAASIGRIEGAVGWEGLTVQKQTIEWDGVNRQTESYMYIWLLAACISKG